MLSRKIHALLIMHRWHGEALACFQRERIRITARRTPKLSEKFSGMPGPAEQLASASSASTAGRSASLDVPKIGKPKKRVSWRAGSLDDVAQASSDRAGLATPEELAQLDRPEQFTWKVRLLLFLYRDRLSRQIGSGHHLNGAIERCWNLSSSQGWLSVPAW